MFDTGTYIKTEVTENEVTDIYVKIKYTNVVNIQMGAVEKRGSKYVCPYYHGGVFSLKQLVGNFPRENGVFNNPETEFYP